MSRDFAMNYISDKLEIEVLSFTCTREKLTEEENLYKKSKYNREQ